VERSEEVRRNEGGGPTFCARGGQLRSAQYKWKARLAVASRARELQDSTFTERRVLAAHPTDAIIPVVEARPALMGEY
jgi:hypothetical protein